MLMLPTTNRQSKTQQLFTRRRNRLRSFLILGLPVILTGCAFGPKAAPNSAMGLALNGNVHGGQQPVSGAHVYLYAANTTGYGEPSVSLLNSADGTVSDSDGNYYVITDASGGFTITGDYSCTQGQQVYLYAQGGDPGSGPNSSVGLLSVLGNCPGGTFAAGTPFVEVNEVTTVAAAYALSGFAIDPTHIADDEAVVSNPTAALAKTGMANAFVNASNLADISSGIARSTTASGSGMVPQATIDTLANILAACINSNGAVTGPDSPTACYTLLNSALSDGISGTVPADTAAAAINIAHHPSLNIATLYGLASSSPPFAPSLTTVPNDFSLGLVFTGGGINLTNGMAVDAAGNVWSTNNSYYLTEISSAGVFLSGSNGYFSDAYTPGPIAIDLNDNIWIGNGAHTFDGPGSLFELSSNGTVLSGANGYGYGLLRTPEGLAVDASNNIWATDTVSDNVVEFSNSGQVLSGANGFMGGGISNPYQLTITPSGNVWVTNSTAYSISQLSNSGAPLTPSTGVTGSGFFGDSSLAIDHQNNVWGVAEGPVTHAQVSKISPAGVVLSGSGYATTAMQGVNGGGVTVSIDGDDNVWTPAGSSNVIELSNTGEVLSGSNGYGGGIASYPQYLVLDGSGDVWVSNATFTPSGVRGVPGVYTFKITELVGVAAPVVTPIAAAVKLNMLGARP
jgi:hypothetical protein